MKSFVLAVSALVIVGCNSDPPKKVDDTPKPTTPVPSDMVFNDFVPANGGSGITGVKTDGGMLEGGMADTPSDSQGGAGGAGGAAAGGDPGESPDAFQLKLIDAGAEPRVARRYAFAVGKVDHRLMTTKQGASREGAPPQPDQTFTVLADFTPKAGKPTSTHYEMKVLKVDAPDAPPAIRAQAASQLAMFTGLTGNFDVGSRGQVSEVDFKADEKMQGGGAEMIIQALQQSLQSAVAELPAEPIGIGAKWEGQQDRKEAGGSSSAKKTYTLTDANAEGGTIEQVVEISVPKHPFQQRGAPPGAMEEMKGHGTYTFVFKWDHLATKATGELAIRHTIEVPAGGGAPKQSVSETVKLKNSFEVAPQK